MAEETWAYDGSNWRLVRDLYLRESGAWREVESGWLYNGTSWKQIFNYDTTGPAAPTSTSATWGGAGATPYCYVYWVQPSDADFSYTRLERSLDNGSSYSFIANYFGNAGAALAYTDYNVSLFSFTFHSALNQASAGHTYRLTPYDTRGNAGTPAIVQSKGQGVNVYRGFLQSPYYRNATGSASWLEGDNSWTSGVSQGYQGSPWFRRRYGHFFYDNTAVYFNLNVTSAGIQLIRYSGAGINVGIPAYLHTSSAGTAAIFGGSPVGSIQNAADPQGSFLYNDNETAPINGGWANAIMTGSSKSIVLDEETYSTYGGYGYSYGYSNWGNHEADAGFGVIFSGTLIINHTG
jgi:hypothetical protein